MIIKTRPIDDVVRDREDVRLGYFSALKRMKKTELVDECMRLIEVVWDTKDDLRNLAPVKEALDRAEGRWIGEGAWVKQQTEEIRVQYEAMAQTFQKMIEVQHAMLGLAEKKG